MRLTNTTGLPDTLVRVAEKLANNHPVFDRSKYSVTEVLAVVLRLVKLQLASLSSPVVPSGRTRLTVTWLCGLSLWGSLQPVATMPIPVSRNRLNLVKTFIFVKCLVINDLLFFVCPQSRVRLAPALLLLASSSCSAAR